MTIRSSYAAALVFIAATASAGGAVAEEAMPASVSKTAEGSILVDAKGMTLYTFDKDSGKGSACNGDCAAAWPPLAADAMAKANGDWSPIKRDDGSSQWAYKDKPLYTWVKDKKPGDVTGDGVKEVWHVAKP